MALERSGKQQVGMKGQQPAFGRQGVVPAQPEDLARHEENHRSLGIIVVFPPATATAARILLNHKNGIELELDGIFRQVGLFQVDDTGQRMQRPASQAVATLVHGLEIQSLSRLLLSLPHRYAFVVHECRHKNTDKSLRSDYPDYGLCDPNYLFPPCPGAMRGFPGTRHCNAENLKVFNYGVF